MWRVEYEVYPFVGSDIHNHFKQNSKPTFLSHKIEAS